LLVCLQYYGKTAKLLPRNCQHSLAVINWTELNWTQLNWTELNWTQLNWTELNWTELNWTQLNSTELNWTMTCDICSILIRNTVKQIRSVAWLAQTKFNMTTLCLDNYCQSFWRLRIPAGRSACTPFTPHCRLFCVPMCPSSLNQKTGRRTVRI